MKVFRNPAYCVPFHGDVRKSREPRAASIPLRCIVGLIMAAARIAQKRNTFRTRGLMPTQLAGDTPMIWTIAVILFVLWLLGFVAFHVGSGLIHLLLVLAVVAVIYQLVTGRRSV